MSWTFDVVGTILILIMGALLIVLFADLLIMLIRYRIEMDEWKYPINMENFRNWLHKKENEKGND